MPQLLKIVTVTSTSVTLQWMPPKYPNGIITHYSIHSGGIVIDNFGDVSDKMIGTIEGLSPDAAYVLQLQPHTRVGPGPPASLVVKTRKLLNNDAHYLLNPELYIIFILKK